MKKMMMALAVAGILPSCNKDDEPSQVPSGGRIAIVIPTDSMENHATITFGCSTTTTAVRPMTRAALSSISLTDLWVYDLPSGQTAPTLIAHQTSEDADFGAPTVTAEYGDHTFYFVASRGDTPTIDGTTISWAKPSDTFWSSLAMTVAPSTSSSQSITLHRVAARLRVTITDEVPTGLAVLSVTPSHWYYGLDITTGEATDDRPHGQRACILYRHHRPTHCELLYHQPFSSMVDRCQPASPEIRQHTDGRHQCGRRADAAQPYHRLFRHLVWRRTGD